MNERYFSLEPLIPGHQLGSTENNDNVQDINLAAIQANLEAVRSGEIQPELAKALIIQCLEELSSNCFHAKARLLLAIPEIRTESFPYLQSRMRDLGFDLPQ